MSPIAPPAVPQVPQPRWPGRFRRTRTFWQRVSEGKDIDDLWAQFTADARASYGFYGKDVDWDEVESLPHWRRPPYIAKQFFWALLMKLSPARRVLLLGTLALFLLSSVRANFDGFVLDAKFEWLSALLLLLLLSLELADKVTMKRDLEIAREIQTWLVPSIPPEVPGGDIAFATRPQNSVAGDYYDAFYPTVSPADGGKLMLVIADVAGKSVPAALLMATMQASLRTVAGSELIARASSALDSPAASRAASSSFTIRSMVAIRIDCATYSRRNWGSSTSRARSSQNMPCSAAATLTSRLVMMRIKHVTL